MSINESKNNIVFVLSCKKLNKIYEILNCIKKLSIKQNKIKKKKLSLDKLLYNLAFSITIFFKVQNVFKMKTENNICKPEWNCLN